MVSTGSNAAYEHDHRLCLGLLEPDLNLLHNHPKTRHLFARGSIDRAALDQIKNPTLETVLLGDQLRFEVDAFSLKLCGMDKLATTAKLCKLHKHVLQASYFAPLSNKNFKRMCHLFSKVLNTRCQTRKFPVLALRYMQGFKSTRDRMRLLLTLSLLGNYSARVGERPKGAARVLIYECFHDSEIHPFFETLVKQCSLLIENSLREFVLFSLDSHPWLKRHLNKLMSLPTFASTVQHAMDQVRRYFALFAAEPQSALNAALNVLSPEAEKRALWDLNQLLHPSHAAILSISYRRPNLNPSSFVAANRKHFPLVPIPTRPEISAAKFDSQTEDQFIQWLEEQMLKNDPEPEEDLDYEGEATLLPEEEADPPELEEDDAGLRAVLQELARKDNRPRVEDLPFWKLIQPEVYDALKAVVQRERPRETGAYQRCLEWLPEFGVSLEVVLYTKEILQHYERASVSIEKLKQRFTCLHKFEPYAYTLLQLIAELLKEAERHFSWHWLPYHYRAAQIDALCSRFPVTQEHRILLPSNLCLVFCEVCRTEYSLVRVFVNKTTGKKMYTQYYRCGLRDVVVDYLTNEVYCKRTKVNVRGRCGEHPLTQFPILGRAFWKDGKCYMICGQKDCGLRMEYDPDQCMVNERGAACSDCTQKHNENPPGYEKLVAQYTNPVITASRRCFKCHAELTQAFNVHLLPAVGVYLCKHHVKPWLMREVRERFGDTVTANRVELEKFMLEKIAEARIKYKYKNEERNKRRLASSKRAQSFRRVRR